MPEPAVAYLLKGFPRISELFIASEPHRVAPGGVGACEPARVPSRDCARHSSQAARAGTRDECGARPIPQVTRPPLGTPTEGDGEGVAAGDRARGPTPDHSRSPSPARALRARRDQRRL